MVDPMTDLIHVVGDNENSSLSIRERVQHMFTGWLSDARAYGLPQRYVDVLRTELQSLQRRAELYTPSSFEVYVMGGRERGRESVQSPRASFPPIFTTNTTLMTPIDIDIDLDSDDEDDNSNVTAAMTAREAEAFERMVQNIVRMNAAENAEVHEVNEVDVGSSSESDTHTST